MKLGMWNLAMAGLLPRMVNMIHDEVLYCLWPEELETVVPVVEECMVRGMRVATPHVRVGVETTCGFHWEKKAKKFVELDKSADGRYIIEEPKFVKAVYGIE